jgi:hypothetical protein
MSVKASAKILVGCIGISLIILGLVILTIEISQSASLGEWRATTTLDVLHSPQGGAFVPDAFLFWLGSPRTFKALRDIVVWTLDFVPIWLGTVAIGLAILWKAVKMT